MVQRRRSCWKRSRNKVCSARGSCRAVPSDDLCFSKGGKVEDDQSNSKCEFKGLTHRDRALTIGLHVILLFLMWTMDCLPLFAFTPAVMPRITAVLPESYAASLNNTLQGGEHDVIQYMGTSSNIP